MRWWRPPRFARLASSLLVVSSLALDARPTARVLGYGSPAPVAIDAATLDRGVTLFRDAIARDELRGAVLMVARHGTIVLHEALGWRHHAYRLPMEKDTLFRMASNTKPVAATAVLMLEQDGRLRVEDRVGEYVPSFDSYRSREITIAHLLSHTSGLRIGPIFYSFDDEKKGEAPTLLSAVERFGREGPEVEPGTSYSYGNVGYSTLASVTQSPGGVNPREAFQRLVTDACR